VSRLTWDGCVNVRDLGGLAAAGGATTQFGRIVRADNIQRLSRDGWRALENHGVRRIVDLRMQREIELDPPAEAPVEIVNVSVLGEWTDDDQAFYDAQLDASDGAAPYLAWSYLEFLDRYRANFGRAVQAIADAPDGAVVVHCMGGKDRTGIVSALALRLVGVEIPVIAEDYALSEANLAERHQLWVDEAISAAERRRREMLLPTPAEAMLEVLVEVDARHGSAADYLISAGVTKAGLARLEERLVAP
jgi:protein-tyrosine phosphatase